MKIKLYNRNGADLYLEKVRDIEPKISEWKLKVDPKHLYCLEYIRVVRAIEDIESIDPSGGPFMSVGDELDYFPKVYKIVNITSSLKLWLSEGHNDN